MAGASGFMTTIPQRLVNGSYTCIFLGMGIFTSPYRNNAGAIANGGFVMYPVLFCDNMAACDNVKNMMLQMAAFVTALQQIYGRDGAEMGALAGSSAFTISAPLAGGLPNTVAGPGQVGTQVSISSQSMDMRSP